NDATLWTIDDLSARVAEALSAGYAGVRSGRVRNVPDCRTIRYYTTLGLLDRPAVMRGRTALYGPRHLLQLVAIKRLQAQGLSLACRSRAWGSRTRPFVGLRGWRQRRAPRFFLPRRRVQIPSDAPRPKYCVTPSCRPSH